MPAKDRIQDIYTLSPLQEGLLYHNLVTDAGSYVVQTAYQLQGQISPQLVEQSLERLFRRYDILRTAFVHEGLSKMVQVVLKERVPDMHYGEIEREDDIDGFIENYLEQDRLRGFDLAKDVLMRVALFRTAQGAYTFIWSYHHILMDGWCTAILIREFNEIYRALLQGVEPQLPAVTQFSAFIQWLEKQDKAAAQSFWKNYLAGYETPSRIPGAAPATPAPFVHREVVNVLDASMQARLQEVCLEHKITMSTLLQTAWGLLLGRYNDCRDVVYGTVSTLRPPGIRGIETMVGLFINTVPLRLCWQANDRFADLAIAHQQSSLETRSFEFCSLADIQSNSYLHNNLFDHLLVISSAPALGVPAAQGGEGGAGISSVRSLEQVNYPFSINITHASELTIRFTYNARVYRQEMVNRMAKNFIGLLEQIAGNPMIAVSSINCISTGEQEGLMKMGLGPVRTYTGTIDSLFAAVAARQPEAIALQTPEGGISYQELHHNSTTIAIGLESRGLRPGAPVALLCQRSASWVTGLLAIWKAGGVYVPLERAHPDNRLEFILSDVGARFLLTDEAESQRLPEYTYQRINIDQPDRKIYPYGTCCAGSKEDSLAYLIYTSGTSGQPKGVPITQANLVERILWHNEFLDVDAQDRMLQFASLAFDASLVELLMPLLAGGCLVMMQDEVRTNVSSLVRYMDEAQVSMAILPPAYLRLMDRAPLPFLKKIISTGEAAALEEMIWYGRDCSVYNGYGPTEACVGASFHQVCSSAAADYRLHRNIPIGQPFANTVIRLLSANGQLMPMGAEGEICIGGPHLTQGYWHQPDLSSEKFMLDPYGIPGQRLYRTGDLGCWNENGELEYRGRLDEQVQIHGIRVETAEIEGVIKNFEGVQDAVVRLWKEENDVHLAAYIIESQSIDLDALRAALQKDLPYYMVPNSLQVLSSYPLTANGKLDARALPKPAPRAESTRMEPQTASEKNLALLWEKILEKRIGITDNFFTSGGHSIKGIKLITLIEKEFKVVLTLENIFQYPTIQSQAKFIDATLWVSAVPAGRTGEVESLII